MGTASAKRSLLTSVMVASLSLFPAPRQAVAYTALQRCQTSDGTRVYTDRACAAFGARTLPIPGEVLTRIVREEAREARGDPEDPAAQGLPSGVAATRRSVAAGCARSPRQLEADLRGSFALADVNRLAESYHWVGMSNRAGQQALEQLRQLVRKPLLDSHYFSTQLVMASLDAAAPLDAADAGGGTLQVVLGGRHGGTDAVMDFRVRRYAGCYFIQFPSAAGDAL